MLMKITPAAEPLEFVRACIAPENLLTFELLVGTISVPIEQPNIGLFIQKLAGSFLLYVQDIPFVRAEFQSLVAQVSEVHESIAYQCKEVGLCQPRGQTKSRILKYPEIALLELLSDEQTPLKVALGAEVALALLDQSKLNAIYCTHLRKDAKKFGRPQGEEQRDPADLAELRFGNNWLPRFLKTDREIRRRVELLDPNDPLSASRPDAKHRMDLLARLKWRFDYPNPKHRQASLDDSHLQMEQFCRAAIQTRTSLEAGAQEAVVEITAMLTAFPPDIATWIPLIAADRPLHILGFNVQRGTMCLELEYLFPFMKRPSSESAYLFMVSSDMLEVPLPEFFAKRLRALHEVNPNAHYVGDLAGWPLVTSRDQLDADEFCKLNSSLARASKSTGAIAIQTGATRLAAACVTWDFSLIGSARMYYARLTGHEIYTACQDLYQEVGWGNPSIAAEEIGAAGSHCTLSDDGATALFTYLANRVTATKPGRNCGFELLATHHENYTRYTVALLSFCLGLRTARVYRLLSKELIYGQTSITVHDKQGGEKLMEQSAALNKVAFEQIAQYIAHCNALIRRLAGLETPSAKSLSAALQRATAGEGFLFITQNHNGAIRPAGARFVWDALPPELRVPANGGRHYWQNKFRLEGLLSRDIDRWMRHRVVGLENNTTSQVSSSFLAFQRINRVQISVLKRLGIAAISGIRRAGK